MKPANELSPTEQLEAFAACKEVDPEIFFPDNMDRPSWNTAGPAREICNRCPVFDICGEINDTEEDGKPPDEIQGIYAGEIPSERIARRLIHHNVRKAA